jgi:hypothetical protein
MKFQVPQFIETETKLVGPFTLKQFLWIAGGASILFVLYTAVKGIWFFFLAVPIAAAATAFAFLKVDGMPLLNYLAYALSYMLSPKKYVYKKEGQAKINLNLPTQNP